VLSGACTLVGAIVGAGFLSGREIFVYFSRFGAGAYLGMLVAVGLFSLIFYNVMCFCRERKIQSVKELCTAGLGKAAGKIAYFALLGGAVTICASMISCTNAFCIELLGWDNLVGGAVTALFGLVITLLGIKSIRMVNLLMVPAILLFLLAITVLHKGAVQSVQSDFPFALISGIVFVLYNSAMSFGVLAGVSRTPARKVTAIACIVIVLLLLMLNRLMQTLPSEAAEYEIPFAVTLAQLPYIYTYLYSAVLWFAIFTTYLSSLYCFSVQKAKICKQTALYSLVTITAFVLSLIGFSNIVSYVYPLSAVSGLVLLIGILYRRMKKNEIICSNDLCDGENNPK